MGYITLSGCQSQPLAGYLKGLGILRLVSQQLDQQARGQWTPQGFALITDRTENEVQSFFLDDYAPTPIVSPWNGGSGFGPKDNHEGIDALVASAAARLDAYRNTISVVQELPKDAALEKSAYIQLLRNRLPDAALDWVDAATVLTDEGAAFPVLLGTGGNDGRLDFSNNFMQRLCDVLCLRSGRNVPTRNLSAQWLSSSLFGGGSVKLLDAAIGQFDPGAAGGSNSSPAGKGKSLVNPWDFVLMLEGSVVFAAAAVRRRGAEKNDAAVPFSFAAAPTGYASAARENGRGEIWAPLWSESATFSSVQTLFAEGRLMWNGKRASNAVDAVRAVATLQFDRRISAFERYVIAERFGLSNVAVPVGRVPVPEQRRTDVDLTRSVDRWLDRIRRIGDRFTPTGVLSALRATESALMALGAANEPGAQSSANLVFSVLSEVASLERHCSRSSAVKDKVPPLSGLSADPWLAALASIATTSEARIAIALCAGRDIPVVGDERPLSLRTIVLPVSARSAKWSTSGNPLVDGIEYLDPIQVLARAAVLRRRTIKVGEGEGQQPEGVAFARTPFTALADAVAFANGSLSSPSLRRWLLALVVLDYSFSKPVLSPVDRGPISIDALSGAVLAHTGRPSGLAGTAPLAAPSALATQLMTRSPGAIRTLESSLRGANRTPCLPQDLPPTGAALAASLLLQMKPTDVVTCVDAASFRTVEQDKNLTPQPGGKLKEIHSAKTNDTQS